MHRRIRKCLLFVAVCFPFATPLHLYPQARPLVPQTTVEVTALRQMTRQSGAIFAGRVISVQYLRPRFIDEVPTMRVTFRVEKGIRGTKTGSRFVLREWAGLWNDRERYRVGERVLLFLYPPSRVGLTSPVGGERGRFHIDAKGQVIVKAERAQWFEGASARRRPIPGGMRDRMSLGNLSRILRRFQAEGWER